MIKKFAMLGLSLYFSGFAAASATPVNMEKSLDEAVDFLQDYLRIDTTNPPGSEELGAKFLADILRKEGLEAQLYQTAPGRSCVYARLKGNGKKRPIILLNHIDVVPAAKSDWSRDPFSGEIYDGEIWGRGAIDMKGFAVAQLESLLMLKRSGNELERDIIFLGTPDEEVGGKWGAEWFVKNHPELVKDAEFLINEGAFIDADENGKARYWGVAVSEKSVLWLKLTARGDAGHASMPMPDSSTNRLVRSLYNVVQNPPPPTVLPAVREYFKQICSSAPGPLKAAYASIDETVKKPGAFSNILTNRMQSSMLRNTVSLTVLKAGYKTNVIPAEASAELDCRLLPGVNKDGFIDSIKKTMNDDKIDVSILDWVHTDASPYDTECFQAIKAVAAEETPDAPVVPMVMPWFTDSHWFRDLGIISYGFAPFRIDERHLATMHGKDERLQVSVFRQGTASLYKVLAKLCIGPTTKQ